MRSETSLRRSTWCWAVSTVESPLTVGTAGHVDHGKTSLIRALTGVDTDRLEVEQRRGLSIELGYAPLRLPSGRRLSVIDVPGHERFVHTMVAGATGFNLFLMTIAADDGVMPQTREHAAVLRALDVKIGIVAVTKADRTDPDPAIREAAQLLPGLEIVPCSAQTKMGVAEVADALARAASRATARAQTHAQAVLHVDRVFTIRGAGTVVTGTLWSGVISRGQRLRLLPAERELGVRGVQVHDEPVQAAQAGQRVAVNLSGIAVREVSRGDVLADANTELAPARVLDCALDLPPSLPAAHRVQVHHGTRDAPGRLVRLNGELWQIRLEQALLAAAGDRVVVRSIAPPDTLGGGVILDARARRHGSRGASMQRLERLHRGEPEPAPMPAIRALPRLPAPQRTSLSAAGLELEERLRRAGHEPPSAGELGDAAAELPTLVAAGKAIRVGRDSYAHPEAIEAVRRRAVAIIEAEGEVSLARLRDELTTSRKFAQMLIEHLDAARVTLRRPDNSRVLRRR